MADSKKVYYVLHNGKFAGIYGNWKEFSEKVKETRNPVFRKISNESVASHFLKNGVLPWNSDVTTKHIFLSETSEKYAIFFMEKCQAESIPGEWGEDFKGIKLSSLLGLSKALNLCFPFSYSHVILHFEYPYAFNCATKWVALWKERNWVPSCSSGGKTAEFVKFIPLLKIIDSQIQAFPKGFLHFRLHKEKHEQEGIKGFIQAKEILYSN